MQVKRGEQLFRVEMVEEQSQARQGKRLGVVTPRREREQEQEQRPRRQCSFCSSVAVVEGCSAFDSLRSVATRAGSTAGVGESVRGSRRGLFTACCRYHGVYTCIDCDRACRSSRIEDDRLRAVTEC